MDTEEVQRVTFTARLELEDYEKKKFEEGFEDILDWFSGIDQVETEDVEPTFHPIDLENEMRSDEIEDTLSQKEALENTEHEEDGFFKGPKIR